MIEQFLISLGLSDKETSCYLTLLRIGTQSTSFIAKQAKLNRGTAYVSLHALLEKGLVVKSTKKKIQYFTALEPDCLNDYLQRRQLEIENQKESLNSMMGHLTAIRNPHTTRPKIEYFEGLEGARTALEHTLHAQEKTLLAYLSISDIPDFLGKEFFEQYTKRRVEAGYLLRVIRNKEQDLRAQEKNIYAKTYGNSKKYKREVRYAAEELLFPVSMYMYDNHVAFISSEEEAFGFIVESREFSGMQKKIFSMLWMSLGERILY